MAQKIRMRRGLKAKLPTLSEGEIGFCTDTKELFIGSNTGNIAINGGSTGGEGALVFATLSELQTTFPNGSVQPAWVSSDNCFYYWDGEISGDTTPPNNATSLVSSNLTNTSVTLTWTASSSVDIASYDIYKDGVFITNTSETTYNATGLTHSSQYTFSVRAKDNSGNVATGTNLTITTTTPIDTTPPNNVTNLSVSNVTQTSLTLTWAASDSTDVASYDIYNGATFLANVSHQTIVYNVSGLTFSTNYTFNVRAKDGMGNVASGTSVNVTTSAPSDTTPPVITVSPVGGNYSTSQNVTLSANETTTIYYTLDGSTPTISSQVYSAPISINSTTPLKYFGKDTAGNSSTTQTQVYTIDTPITGPTMLSMNGTSDYIQLPILTFDEINMDIQTNRTGVTEYYFDNRTGGTAYLIKNSNGTESIGGTTSVYVNGVLATQNISNVTINKRTTIKAVFSSVTDDLTIFARNAINEFMKGKIYKIKLFLAGDLVASYDFTTQFEGSTIQDNSGNGNDATLFGGTWEEDNSPQTGTGTSYYLSLDGVDDSIIVPIPGKTKYIDLRMSRENNDSSGYIIDLRNSNTVYSTDIATAGYSTFMVDGINKTVGNANSTTDLPNGVTVNIRYILSTLTKSGNITIGTRSVTPAASDYKTMKVFDLKFYDDSSVLLAEYDFTTGTGTTLYEIDSGMNGTIKGGTWVAI